MAEESTLNIDDELQSHIMRPQARCGHVAVHLNRNIVIFGGGLMVRFFHVVEIVGTTCELVGTSRVCFNHVVRSRACACTNVQRDASRHCRHYVIVLFHVVTCSTDAEPVCRAFLSSLLCRLLVITRKSRDCSVT